MPVLVEEDRAGSSSLVKSDNGKDGYFGGRCRLAGELRLKEGEPLAPELGRYA